MANVTPSAPALPGTLGASLANWFRSPRIDGVVRGAGYIMVDGSVFAIDLTNWDHRTPPIGAVGFVLECGKPGAGWWSSEVWSDLFGQILRGIGNTPLEAVANAAENVAEREAEERDIRANALLHLDRELAHHDWYSHMSESYGTVKAGERHAELIGQLLASVPVREARAMWEKHAPPEFVCPV